MVSLSLDEVNLLKSQPGPPTGASFRGFRGFCKAGATLAVERQSASCVASLVTWTGRPNYKGYVWQKPKWQYPTYVYMNVSG